MDNSNEFAKQMVRIIDQLFFLEKSNTFVYGENLKLHASEIYLILLINEGCNRNITEMANTLHVTKGAVSQTISRLEKKGIIKKTKDIYNKNELTVSFTPIGKKVLQKCLQMQSYLINKFKSYYLSLSNNDQIVMDRFLSFFKRLFETNENNL